MFQTSSENLEIEQPNMRRSSVRIEKKANREKMNFKSEKKEMVEKKEKVSKSKEKSTKTKSIKEEKKNKRTPKTLGKKMSKSDTPVFNPKSVRSNNTSHIDKKLDKLRLENFKLESKKQKAMSNLQKLNSKLIDELENWEKKFPNLDYVRINQKKTNFFH